MGTRPGRTPADAVWSGDKDHSGAPTPGPNHPLQPVEAATPYISGGPPGRPGYVATSARDGDASTLRPAKSACGREWLKGERELTMWVERTWVSATVRGG